MICYLCSDIISDDDFLVGVSPEATEASEMVLGHTLCVKTMTNVMLRVLDTPDWWKLFDDS